MNWASVFCNAVIGAIFVETSSRLDTFTEGSVLFANSVGEITEDNDNFFWDDANDILQLPNLTASGDITSVNFLSSGYMQFADIATPTDPAAGHMRLWSEDEFGFSGLHFKDENGIEIEIGEDTFLVVRNTTGTVLSKGEWVHINGANGQMPTVARAQADSNATMPAIGIVIQDIADNSNGKILTQGDLGGLDTSGFNDGDIIYISETVAGAATATEPTGTDIDQRIGEVIKGGSVGGGIIKVFPGTAIDPGLNQTFTNKTFGDQLLVDSDNAEAVLIRKDGDGGDVFTIDTVSDVASFGTGVDLIMDTGFIDVGVFTDGNEPAANAGRIFFSDEEDVLSFYDGDNVEVNIGQDMTVRAKNVTGAELTKGDAVYVSGASGLNPEVMLAQADDLATSRLAGLVLKSTIANNAVGKIITRGRITGVDTSMWTAGDELFVSATTPGALTNTSPTNPDNSVFVGIAVNSSANDGIIFVDSDRRIDNFTQGSVPFADSAGDLTQNNTDFNWDDTAFELTIGGTIIVNGANVANDEDLLQSTPGGASPGEWTVTRNDDVDGNVVMRLGNSYLWVDNTGDLRISGTYPTTDLDGVVVGTQS